MQDKNLPILHSQYHGYCFPGDARSQRISNHDIDYVEPEWFHPCMLRVDTTAADGLVTLGAMVLIM